MEVHAALRRPGRAGGEGDDRDVVGRRVDRRRTTPRAGRSSSDRSTSSAPDLAARASRVDERVRSRCAFSTTFAISPARSSGIVATTIPPASRIAEPRGDRLRRVRRVQQHARRPARSPAPPRPPRRARAARRSSSRPRSPSLVRQQLDRGVDPRRVVEQQQVGPGLRGGQVVAGERVHQSRPASTSFAPARRVREHHLVAARHLHQPVEPEPARHARVPAPLARRQRDVLGAVEVAARDLRRVERAEVELVGEAAVRLGRQLRRTSTARAPRRRR